ncbi:MAG TPA: type II secretion system protein GspN [Pseudomonadota bacterium]|nr:type II secretion system protein GspN [Pseudomonadota bacterium]
MRRFFLRLLRRLRKTSRWVTFFLYAGFGLLVFLLSLSLSLPEDKIKDRLERELSQERGPASVAAGGFGIGTGMDVIVGDLSVHVFRPGITASDVRLRPRKPSNPGADLGATPKAMPPLPLTVDRIDVRLHPVDALFGTKSGRLEVEAFGGEVTADGSQGSDGVAVTLQSHDITLGRVSAISGLLPLPMIGTAGLSLQIAIPNQKQLLPPAGRPVAAPPVSAAAPRLDLAKAEGKIDLLLSQASVGDGKAKLVIPGDPFLSQGVTFPRIRLGDVIGKVTIERGRAKIVDLHAKSPDVELWIDGQVELRDPLDFSELRLYVRFKPSAQLVAREPTLELVTNSQSQGKRQDGALGFAVTGTLANPRARPAKDPPDGVSLPKATLGQVAPQAFPSLVPGAKSQPTATEFSASRPSAPSFPLPPPQEPPPSYSPPPATGEEIRFAPGSAGLHSPPPPPSSPPPPPNPLANAPAQASQHVPPPGFVQSVAEVPAATQTPPSEHSRPIADVPPAQ